MPSNPPFPIAREQRLLAAIVFTDAAGYSARVHRTETAGVELIEQDFAVMRKFSEEFSGTVLKTTGDGLLLYFTSAVQAMKWSLRTQRHFAERARSAGDQPVYHHRVGVHIGDVFLKEDDVMGDGVNIAARVQGEAPPGGICISQTAYDVVKNKMELHVIRLEPRRLKNIHEQIQMYHVLLEEPKPQHFNPAGPVVATRRAPVAAPAKSGSGALWLALAILVLVGASGGVWWSYSTHEEDLARSKASHAALGALLPDANKASNDALPKSPPPTDPDPLALDFAKLTTDQPASPADAAVLDQAKAALPALEAWLRTQLPRYTRDRPLLVRDLRGTSPDQTLYSDADGTICFAEGGAVRRRAWSTLSPETQAAIIVATLRYAPEAPPREAVRGAEAFGYVHRLPAMANALVRERSAGKMFRR